MQRHSPAWKIGRPAGVISQGAQSFSSASHELLARSGPRVAGLVGPNRPVTGMPSALAMFIRPLSLETK
jgi:hypothetical protein